ncbi:helix-turn-helix transcriptional regulator [Streptomyces sp. G-G2]|uniref:helix-turn-helix domain-containing protein n=1 Tax=Streptomyces sp. G-G2 TaxID=3046201 RepID=UPI0024BA0C38|nr:helix-turn-helix transcriptional regulator [Streptomyces sp. G-G2]MDJ0382969.1 helix-turn-helix transcriptional regulator [Streptomyces sp. G-G2]
MPADPFGHLLLRLRMEAGRTQEQQAAAINTVSGRDTVTRREISRYENSENIPTAHTLTHIAVACGFPPAQLQREAADARARRRYPTNREDPEWDDMERRKLIGGVVMGAAVASEPWGRLAHALAKGSRVDAHAVDALTKRADALHTSENHLTARQLRGHVEAHLDALTAALPRAPAYERDLGIAAGETAALAGWIAWDLGDHPAARSYYRVAVACADASGHPPLRALALAYASYGAAGRPRGLELLTRAVDDVRGPGNATAAAWIHARHAEEAAATGDATAALRALDRARTAYDYADHTAEQAWVRFMTPARMDCLVLSVYGRLGRPELAEAAAAATRRLGGELADAGVVVLGDLAAALLAGGDIDQGVHVARRFVTAADARPNTMGRARALGIAARLPDREGELRARLEACAA